MSRFGSGHDAAFFLHAPQFARGAAAGGAGSAVGAGGAQRLGFGLFAAGAAGGAGHGRAAASKRRFFFTLCLLSALAAPAAHARQEPKPLRISYVRAPFNLKLMVMKEKGILQKRLDKTA